MARRAGPGWLAAAAAVVALGGALRFWGIGLGLPHLMARPDDEAVLVLTGLPARGQFDLGWVMYPSAWVYLNWAWAELALRAGAVVGLWPRASYVDVLNAHPERILLLCRMLTAACGTAAVAASIAVARAGFGAAAGLVAGVLLAVDFLHARDAHSMKPDVALSLGIVVTLGACLALERGASLRRGVAAGLGLGVATACKYPGVVLGVPIWLASVLGSAARGWRRLLPASAPVAAVVALAVFVSTSPFLVTSPVTREMMGGLAAIVFPSLGTPTPVMPAPTVPGLSGFSGSSLPYHLTVSLSVATGVAGAVLLPIALVWALVARPPLALPTAVFLLAWLAMVGLSPIRLMRYLTPATPVIALLQAGALAAAARRLGGTRGTVALVLATAALAAQPLAATVAHDRLAARTDTRVLATQWLGAHVAPGDRVAVVGTVFWGWGQPAMPPGVTAVFLPTLDAGTLADSKAAWLLAHDHVLFSSRTDEAALASLAGRLTPAAVFDPFVGPREGAHFEDADAYYLPYAGFHVLERPGPRVRIYRVEPAGTGNAGKGASSVSALPRAIGSAAPTCVSSTSQVQRPTGVSGGAIAMTSSTTAPGGTSPTSRVGGLHRVWAPSGPRQRWRSTTRPSARTSIPGQMQSPSFTKRTAAGSATGSG